MKLLKFNRIYGPESAVVKLLVMVSTANVNSYLWKLCFQIQAPIFLQILGFAIRRCCWQFFILLFTCLSVFGKVRNGYEKDISATTYSLNFLQSLLVGEELTPFQRRKVEASIEVLVNHLSYFTLTDNLLNQFKIIAPVIFTQIDTITDKLGRPVDVYVKFVPKDATEVKAWGTTYANQMESDRDAYLSEYGPFTVSVKIWTVQNALLVLAHEFGHVKYQVPNLDSYMTFHKKNYKNQQLMTFVGHLRNDPSGKTANQFGADFKKQYLLFLKSGNEKIQNPEATLARIRRILSNKYYTIARTTRLAEFM